jgi:TPR repeat protein
MNMSTPSANRPTPIPHDAPQDSLAEAESLYQRAQFGLQPTATTDERQQSLQDLQAAAHVGHLDSIVQLAQVYADGVMTHKNLPISLHFWLKAAELGDIRAQLRVAEQYAQGIGVQRNIQQASMWYGKAAAQGNIEAKMQLTQLDWGDEHSPSLRRPRSPWRNLAYALLGFMLIITLAMIFS